MKKFSISHPLYVFLLLPVLIVLGGATIMMHLDRIYKLPNYVNAIVGISLGVFSLLWLLLFFRNFGKLIKKEENTKMQKIKKYAFSNKTFILIQKRSVLANYALVLGGLSVFVAWLIFLPVDQFNHYGYWIFRVVSILVTVLGAIFSFITPQKMLIYKNGKLTITTNDRSLTILPSKLRDYKQKPTVKDKNRARQELLTDVILYLDEDEILLKKADCVMFLKRTIQVIKEIELNTIKNQID